LCDVGYEIIGRFIKKAIKGCMIGGRFVDMRFDWTASSRRTTAGLLLSGLGVVVVGGYKVGVSKVRKKKLFATQWLQPSG
jgi:hypothetical protein